MTPRAIRAIFCDVGNVLLWFDLRTTRLLDLAAIFNPARFSDGAAEVERLVKNSLPRCKTRA